MDVKIQGVSLDVDGSVRFVYESTSSTTGGSSTAMSVDGAPLAIDGGTLSIGEHRFEGLKDGDSVLLSKDGIQVNGEKRWDWPLD